MDIYDCLIYFLFPREQEEQRKERQDLKIDKKTLANLRSEHSRLKDDFR